MHGKAPSQASEFLEKCSQYLAGPDLPVPTARGLAGELVSRYDERWRHYHTAAHLLDMAGFLIEVADDLDNPQTVFWATTGHDSIYLPKNTGGMNERLSGALTGGLVMPYLPAEEVRAIDRYICATADHGWDGKDMDLAYFLDADMKILGAPAEEFDEYDANIRLEYDIFKDEVYRPGRAAILKGFYDQPRLFHHGHGA
jgi:predicted metal-dependent HD superfamily phosphohydrolase